MSILKSMLNFAALCLLLMVQVEAAEGFFWNSRELAVIDGESFTTDDFRNWWREWREPGMPLPENPTEFIDWMLLSREARQMQLDQRPAFREKVEIFLKVRSLMQLRREEVLDRISRPSRGVLWGIYQKDYAPQFRLRLLAARGEEEAEAVLQAIGGGRTLTDVAGQMGLTDPALFMKDSGLLRPHAVPLPLAEGILHLSPGQVGGPFAWKDVWYVVEVLERKDSSEEDFAALRETLVQKHLKREEDRLSAELLNRLRVKYRPMVDADLLESITEEGLPAGRENEVVVRAGEMEIAAGSFRDLVLRERKKFSGPWGDLDFARLKGQVAQDMVSQTLLGMEALDRGYQKRPPLEVVLEFYRQNRLIRELERELLWPRVEVSPLEIQREYENNPDRFIRQRELLELALVETRDARLAEVLEGRIKKGEDYSAVMKVLSPDGIPRRKVPRNHLKPPLGDVVSGMSPGEVRMATGPDGGIFFIKFIGETARELYPLEAVQEGILEDLRQRKFAEVRRGILEKLRERSVIVLRNDAWKKVREELSKEKGEERADAF